MSEHIGVLLMVALSILLPMSVTIAWSMTACQAQEAHVGAKGVQFKGCGLDPCATQLGKDTMPRCHPEQAQGHAQAPQPQPVKLKVPLTPPLKA